MSSTRAPILVVDDTPANLTAFTAVLEALGEPLLIARSGEEALRILLEREVAVILMDVQMPGLNGLETAGLIRGREKTKHIPILFITAIAREMAYVMDAYSKGAVDYLLKPVDSNVLRAKVQVFVELYQRGEALRKIALEQQLAAIVGHDIRTPLSAILATSEFQLRNPTLGAAERIAFERVNRGGQRISHIVELLMDFTRARIGEQMPISRTPGDLISVARLVLDELSVVHPGRTMRLETNRESIVGDWDFKRLAQVLANLLENAIKYSVRNTPVTLRLEAHDPDAVSIEVHNDGPAIPEEHRARLFEPFRRAAVSSLHGQGLGLGLFIVHEIVRSHGGTVSVDSTHQEGTTFRVNLPRHTREALTGGADAQAVEPVPQQLSG